MNIRKVSALCLSLLLVFAAGAPFASATDVVSNTASVTLSYTQAESITLTATSANPTLGWCPSTASLTTAATCSGGFGGGYAGGAPVVVTATNNLASGHAQEMFYSWVSSPSSTITAGNVQEQIIAGNNLGGAAWKSCNIAQSAQQGYNGTAFTTASVDPGVNGASGGSSNFCSTGNPENSGAITSGTVSVSFEYQVTGFATIPTPNSYSFVVNYLDVVY